MTAAERRWLRQVEGRPNLDDSALAGRFSAATVARARQAYRLLIG
jgi:hypothetical protein